MAHAEEFTPGTAGLVKFSRPVLPVAGWISLTKVALMDLSLQVHQCKVSIAVLQHLQQTVELHGKLLVTSDLQSKCNCMVL